HSPPAGCHDGSRAQPVAERCSLRPRIRHRHVHGRCFSFVDQSPRSARRFPRPLCRRKCESDTPYGAANATNRHSERGEESLFVFSSPNSGGPVKEIIATDRAPKAIGPYSQAVRANGLIFVSGQIALDPVTQQLVSGGITEQTVRVLENLKGI